MLVGPQEGSNIPHPHGVHWARDTYARGPFLDVPRNTKWGIEQRGVEIYDILNREIAYSFTDGNNAGQYYRYPGNHSAE